MADDARCLVYGPRLGRLYLLAVGDVESAPLRRALGLDSYVQQEDLRDPAFRVLHDLPSLRRLPARRVSRALVWIYRLLHWSRSVAPFPWVGRLLLRLARRSKWAPRGTSAEIGRVVHAVERMAGVSDCYPRALLTAFLCAASGQRCELVVGTLAPTRNMHAWCCTDGSIPFEPSPEHHMFQPLLVLPLEP
jgi:hypothetical protein